MTSLYIDRKEVRIELEGDVLVFREQGERVGTVPIAPLDRVVLKGTSCIDIDALGKLGSQGVGVIFLSGRKSEPTLLLPCPHHDARRRVMQYFVSRSRDFCRRFSVNLIQRKVEGQLNFLKEIQSNNPNVGLEFVRALESMEFSLKRIADSETSEILRGLEGHAAQCYFGALANILPDSLHFKGRARRPPPDPFNAILSLLYTIAVSEAALLLYEVGLDPYVGFFHTMNFSRLSLACDAVEVVRPSIDRFARALFAEQVLRVEDFSTTEIGCTLGKAGRVRFYQAYEKFAVDMRKTLREDALRLIEEIENHIEANPQDFEAD